MIYLFLAVGALLAACLCLTVCCLVLWTDNTLLEKENAALRAAERARQADQESIRQTVQGFFSCAQLDTEGEERPPRLNPPSL